MSNILTGFNMQGNDPIDNRIVSPSKFETLEEYLQRVPIQKRYYGLSFYALDENNELRHYTFQTSLIEPTIDDDEEEIERLDKELQEHVNNKEIHKTSEEIRSEIVDADIPDTIARVQWTLDQIKNAVDTVMNDIVDGASDEYNTLKKIQDKIVELRTEMESQLYGDDGGNVLKTLEQALKFLNQYKDFIVDIPDNYVNKQDIVDNLNTDDPTKVLSARQGKVLSETLTNYFDSAMASIRAETNRATNAENRIEAKLDSEIDRSTAEDIRIQSELDAEEARAQSEEQRIEDKLDAEIERSTTKDTELGNQIIAETNRAKGEEQRIETKLDNEITRSTAKDADHDSRIEALEGETHIQNTDIGTTSQTFQLQMGKPGNKIKNEDAAVSVRNATDTDYVNFIAKNATFKGNLIVEGQSFVTEAETVEIKDNLLLLNKGEVGAGVTKGIAGLEIDRGTEPNYFIVFDESDNRFKAGVEGDLWNLALRESDDNMLDGYFISWNSKDKILSTTNIVNESTPLLFGRTDYKRYSGDIIYQENVYSSYSFIDETPQGTLYNSAGENAWNINTTKFNFRFWKPILGTTFRRTSDNSEVLYHADIVNNLTSGGTNKVLSAEQGKLLQNSITSIQGSYLPLSGGTMKGNIRFPIGNGIACNDVAGTAAYVVLRTWNANNSTRMYVGTINFPTYISSTASDLIHDRNGSSYLLWDSYNLPTPASTTDLANYLPLIGGTLTGQLTIKQEVDIKLRLQSTDADNHCIIQAINSQASQLGVFGYAGDKWAIGHGGTYYEIWDKYNLANPVTYTTNTYNHATLTNKDGQYFTYIKAGTNGLLPHSKATLVSGGSGFLGTSDQSFNAAYINNLYTNKVTFGVNGPYIIGGTSVTQFLDAKGGVQKVATGELYVGPSYTSDALNLVPASGIYSQGNIRTSGWLTFEDNEWTDTGWAYKAAKGSIKVLSVKDEATNKPTSYGSVLQFNSRQGHWCTQIWCDQTNVAGVIGTLRFRTTKSFASTEWNPWTTIATEPYVSSNYLPLTGGTLTGALTMRNRRDNIVVDVVGGIGNNWDEGAGALSIQVPNDSGQTPLILARRSGAAINTTVATERLLSMELLDTGHFFIIGMSGSEALQLNWTSDKAGTGKLFGKTIATTDQIPSIPSISISNSGSGNAVTAISASGHTLTVTKGATYLTSSSLSGYATQSWVTSQGYLTSSSLSGYATQTWVDHKHYAVRESDNVLISHSNEFNFTASTNTSIAINYRGGSGSSTSAAITEYRFYNGQGSYSNVNILANSFTGSLIGNASSATKLGSSTVGSTSLPIYLNAGTPAVCSSTLGVSITGNAATATNATQLGGTAASSYVKANDNISRLTNDRNYVRSTSTLKVSDIQVLDGGTPGSEAGILYIVLE